MLSAIIAFSVRQRSLILLLTFVLILAGIGSAYRLHIDAVPDITSVQVQINTAVPALAPEEIEQLVTFPIESRLSGMPGLLELRSISRPGLSQITMTFADNSDIYRLRQLTQERLQEAIAELPTGLTPSLAPISTGLSDIVYYTVSFDENFPNQPEDPYQRLQELSIIQEYQIAPKLRTTPGLAEVNTSGGYHREIHVQPVLERLTSLNLTFSDFSEALQGAFDNVGGGLIEIGNEQVVIRSNTRLQDLDDLTRLPVKFAAGTEPITVGDIASVSIGSSIRTGTATSNGEEAVLGAAIMMAGENSRIVSHAVIEKLADIQRQMPAGVVITPLYQRGDLIDATINTVRNNLIHGAILVIVILFLMLGHLRVSLIVASVIPLSMLAAIIGMNLSGVSGNLMSLGAIDFGLIVSGTIIVVENILRHFDNSPSPSDPNDTESLVVKASQEVAKPMFFGVAIITLVYIPILALTGIEGKMFRPMAITVMFALIASLILALTVAPATCSWLPTKSHRKSGHKASRLLTALYQPLLGFALRFPIFISLIAIALFSSSLVLFQRLGSEFIPQLEEGSLAVQMVRANSVGLQTSLELQQQAEQLLLREFPEIHHIFSRIGTAEIATDPMGPNVSDTYVLFHPPHTWRTIDGRPASKSELIELMRESLEQNIPGQVVLFSQPIQLRFNEIMAGARADIAVKIFGDDLEQLENLAFTTRDILRRIPGGGDVEFDAMGRIPMLEILPDRDALRRYNVSPDSLNQTITSALAGTEVGVHVEGNKRTPVISRLAESERHAVTTIRDLPVRTRDGGLIPLERVATLEVSDRVGSVTREMAQRRVAILVNLSGRDTGSFVRDAMQALEQELPIPPGYSISFGGQFENLEQARERLMLVVPLTLGLIFILIHTATRRIKHSLLIFTAIPFAVTGGIFSLYLRGMPFSISAAVGFIALSGIAVMDSLVLLNCFNDLRREGLELTQAVRQGTLMRLRPVLMTSLVAGLGFLPMAIAQSAGAEVQRPLATVVIGGVISSTTLTLLVLPGLYLITSRSIKKQDIKPL